MKTIRAIILTLVLVIASQFPMNIQAATEVESWIAGPWQTQDMISWGDAQLVVDFGINGLWHYDGAWIRLSRWNSEGMAVWGTNLTVNFGDNGLWNFDGSTWKKLAHSDS